MKLHKLLVFMLVFSFAVMTSKTVFAQDEETEMTMEDWQKMMDDYNARKDQLTIQLNNLNTEIDGLKKSNSDKDAALTKAESDLYASVGSTKSGVADYRKDFEATEKMINSKTGTAADARKKFDALKASKIRCLPEFWDRFNAMEKKLLDWEKPTEPPKSDKYTVVKGDCLYKIAANKYKNGKLWPCIWDANKTVTLDPKAPKNTKTKITNPNLIYPGQQLVIPPACDPKKAADLMKSSGYSKWRKKKSSTTSTTTTDTTKKDAPKDVKKDEKKDMKKDEKKDVKKDAPKDVKKDEKKK